MMVFWLGLLGTPGLAIAESIPVCLANGRPLPVNNAQVLLWKKTTANQFLGRGHVTGLVTGVFRDRTSHDHFEIQIGRNAGEVLEVIYNEKFGAMPSPRRGDQVEACGDYITSNRATPRYPKSPSGGVIHWVHVNPSGRGHDSGYVSINGTLYGMDTTRAKDVEFVGSELDFIFNAYREFDAYAETESLALDAVSE